jgi:2Fe-2S ferredoxin
MAIKLHVVDRDSAEHEVDAGTEGSLMEVLRALEYGVTATCGGMCACATCHIYVAGDWADKLPAQQSDERELVNELVFRREESRLSCQISLSQALDGLRVTLAPEE